jgi:hypothetical protein
MSVEVSDDLFLNVLVALPSCVTSWNFLSVSQAPFPRAQKAVNNILPPLPLPPKSCLHYCSPVSAVASDSITASTLGPLTLVPLRGQRIFSKH